ncbi:MAG: type VI secretion system-associated protein TagF [Xanthomonadaceae bacterium]|jgi:type VI secretion system protein ImpM|nr:type VI secretion system-associated protein TagF [Xanthomonadaceae bacterium]
MMEVTLPVSFFGKLPSRGDFVKTSDSHPLMILLDRWAGNGLELLSSNSDWKRLYDESRPFSFAFLGSRSRLAIAGYFLPSADSSQRRFPFLSATRLEISAPLDFIARSPLAFSRLWTTLARLSQQVVQAQEPAEQLRGMSEAELQIDAAPTAYDAWFFDFLDTQSIGSVQDMLQSAGHSQLMMKWALPALGLLLQPALTGTAGQIEKALSLPLSADPLYRAMVATFWLDLISGFLEHSDYELALLIQDSAAPRLVIGFNGADGAILRGLLDESVGREQLIRVDDAEWVKDQLENDYALNKLVGYLDRDEFSLRSARQFFRETFLGA